MIEIGKEQNTFKIILNEDFADSNEIKYRYVIGCDPYLVKEPKNLYHTFRKWMGLKYKEKEVGWEYIIAKVDDNRVLIYDK